MRVALLAVLAACATPTSDRRATGDDVPTDEAGEPLPSAGTAVLRAETVVLPADIARRAVVAFDHVLLPAAIELAPRDVIVSGVGDGFIRRAIAIIDRGDGTLHVTTSPASLAEAVERATFDTSISEMPFAVEQQLAGNVNEFVADITGGLSLAPTVDVGFTIDAGSLERFELAIAGTGSAAVEGTAEFSGAAHWAWGEQRTLETIVFRRAFALGPLPIVLVARVHGTLAASAYVDQPVTLASGAEGAITFDARSTFTGTSWSTTKTSTFDASQIGPAHDGDGMASLALGVTARLELAFYGVAGPVISYSAQAGGFGGYCGATLHTALRAGLFGDGTYELYALAPMERAVVALWDNQIALDPAETCAP